MSTARGGGDVKGFFKQTKKKGGGISKAKGKKSPPKHSATIGSGVTQPAALVSHGSLNLKDDYDATEEILRQFDMNMAYGPCLGLTRLARWERARSLGMNPPENVERLLRAGDEGKIRNECLWYGRV